MLVQHFWPHRPALSLTPIVFIETLNCAQMVGRLAAGGEFTEMEMLQRTLYAGW